MRWLVICLVAVSASAGPETDGALSRYKARRARLAGHLGRDYALILGQPFTDVLNPRQEGHLYYFTGIRDPGVALLIAGAKAKPLSMPARDKKRVKARTAVFLPGGNPKMAQFYGIEFAPGADSAARLGVDLARTAPRGGKGLAATLVIALPKKAKLHLPRYRGGDHGLIRGVRTSLLDELKAKRKDIEIVSLDPFLGGMRSIKDAWEIDRLTKSVTVSHEAFREALPFIRPGSTEGAVDGALLLGVRRRGGEPAYPFVVGSGLHATVPHWFRNDGPLRDGDLLVIDAGAEIDRYAADITRTFPVSGQFSARQREVYQVVLNAQRAAIAKVAPGVTLTQVDRAARDIISKAGLAKFFIHATCHHVGLDVHDPGPARLGPGMTITVEPGVYIPEEKIGVRLEDIVLVTEDGGRVLGPEFPKDVEAVERMLAEQD